MFFELVLCEAAHRIAGGESVWGCTVGWELSACCSLRLGCVVDMRACACGHVHTCMSTSLLAGRQITKFSSPGEVAKNTSMLPKFLISVLLISRLPSQSTNSLEAQEAGLGMLLSLSGCANRPGWSAAEVLKRNFPTVFASDVRPGMEEPGTQVCGIFVNAHVNVVEHRCFFDFESLGKQTEKQTDSEYYLKACEGWLF